MLDDMEDFVYKFKKQQSKNYSNRIVRPVYYYVKDVGLRSFASISLAARNFGLVQSTVSNSCIKSAKQTYEEFVSDNAVNKFIYTDDDKANRLIKEFGLL